VRLWNPRPRRPRHILWCRLFRKAKCAAPAHEATRCSRRTSPAKFNALCVDVKPTALCSRALDAITTNAIAAPLVSSGRSRRNPRNPKNRLALPQYFHFFEGTQQFRLLPMPRRRQPHPTRGWKRIPFKDRIIGNMDSQVKQIGLVYRIL